MIGTHVPERTDTPAFLPPKALRRRNRELEAYGLRICRCHQGIALPLTDEHFYRTCGAGTRFETQCKRCHNTNNVAISTARRRSDPTFAEHRRELGRNDYRKHAETRCAHRRQVYQARRRERLALVLSGVTL